jgi:hypothetical protein
MPEIGIASFESPKIGKRFLLVTEREEWAMKLAEFKLLAIDILKLLEKEGVDVPALVKYAHEHLDEYRFK